MGKKLKNLQNQNKIAPNKKISDIIIIIWNIQSQLSSV